MLQIFNELAWLVHVVILDGVLKKSNSRRLLNNNRPFSLTWPASMLIYWNKRKYLDEKRDQLPEDFLGTLTWQPFHCFGTPIWPPERHVKTLYFGGTFF